jgi:hypothetical protein
LLLTLADPCAMTVRQIELADRWLGQWARKLFPYAQQRESEGPVVVVDLDSTAGALLAPFAPKEAPSCFPVRLSRKTCDKRPRRRLKRLAAGANPGELQLGPGRFGGAMRSPAVASRGAVVPSRQSAGRG